ncbi:L-type lectin-domain containing receptor kinase IX.1-like isoform X2 [Hordeum vulgare subsp. vulgare]|uniref:L-type lectin-domain containing receptor kinase IX.1-like isoform X2 n=1 Tax=Hordeum vulgare subsp. vulgare TaxID=112509 RepID=UPI000B467413|nr:L-type lectin-domain containing receptor kinase IX.1-like isoform X2 [Hordeum vulgare subsp. vulgare]
MPCVLSPHAVTLLGMRRLTNRLGRPELSAPHLIVHCDLKPTNILLDDDMNAYLGDFGIARFIEHSGLVTSTGLKGTIGYKAPEYAQSVHASIHGDVYSFEIVHLEMLTGKKTDRPYV